MQGRHPQIADPFALRMLTPRSTQSNAARWLPHNQGRVDGLHGARRALTRRGSIGRVGAVHIGERARTVESELIALARQPLTTKTAVSPTTLRPDGHLGGVSQVAVDFEIDVAAMFAKAQEHACTVPPRTTARLALLTVISGPFPRHWRHQ